VYIVAGGFGDDSVVEGTLLVTSGGGVDVAGLLTLARVQFLIVARVFGPTAPYPVVAGVPDETILFCDCHCCTARSVSTPKNPVEESDARRF